MEKEIGLFEAKTRLSEVCQEVVSTGRPVRVTRRGEPWVRIVPVGEGEEGRRDIWEERLRWEQGRKKGLGRKAIPLPGGEGENPPIWEG